MTIPNWSGEGLVWKTNQTLAMSLESVLPGEHEVWFGDLKTNQGPFVRVTGGRSTDMPGNKLVVRAIASDFTFVSPHMLLRAELHFPDLHFPPQAGEEQKYLTVLGNVAQHAINGLALILNGGEEK